jgi:hypothetical protein
MPKITICVCWTFFIDYCHLKMLDQSIYFHASHGNMKVKQQTNFLKNS